jgi:hypothetical protein
VEKGLLVVVLLVVVVLLLLPARLRCAAGPRPQVLNNSAALARWLHAPFTCCYLHAPRACAMCNNHT